MKFVIPSPRGQAGSCYGPPLGGWANPSHMSELQLRPTIQRSV